jgi:hypothetical protein
MKSVAARLLRYHCFTARDYAVSSIQQAFHIFAELESLNFTSDRHGISFDNFDVLWDFAMRDIAIAYIISNVVFAKVTARSDLLLPCHPPSRPSKERDLGTRHRRVSGSEAFLTSGRSWTVCKIAVVERFN